MIPTSLISPCCTRCTHMAATPCRLLIPCISEGPLCHQDENCRDERRQRLVSARRRIDDPTAFIGKETGGTANEALPIENETHAGSRDRRRISRPFDASDT